MMFHPFASHHLVEGGCGGPHNHSGQTERIPCNGSRVRPQASIGWNSVCHETPQQSRGLENVTRDSIGIVVSCKWVNYPFKNKSPNMNMKMCVSHMDRWPSHALVLSFGRGPDSPAWWQLGTGTKNPNMTGFWLTETPEHSQSGGVLNLCLVPVQDSSYNI